MMVHVYGLFARTVGQKAAHDPNYPLKSEGPFSDAEIARFVSAGGKKNNEPVEIDFEPVAFSEELVPAAGRLGLPDVPPGKYPSVPQERQNNYISTLISGVETVMGKKGKELYWVFERTDVSALQSG